MVTAFLPRILTPFACVTALAMPMLLFVPEVRNPFALTVIGGAALLFVLLPLQRQMHSHAQFQTRILLIGQRPIAWKFINEIERCPERRYTIIGIVAEKAREPEYSPYLVLGRIDQLRAIVAAVKPDRIVLALSDRRGQMPATELLEFQTAGIVVEDVADAYERVSGKLPIEVVTPGQLIASQRLWKSRALKKAQRVVSFTAALLLLIAVSPFLAVIALAIKLDSGGAILFRQSRAGKDGRPFELLKFRTMVPVECAPSEWVRDNSGRITRLGRWLRRLRLDELPQLVNVIRGDMNLVGPRPHPVTNLQLFRDAIPYYTLRGSIRPGITGWAQVRYHYANNLQEETEKMRYDLYYIEHMSLWMDAKIILSTIGVFLRSLVTSAERKAVRIATTTFIAGSARLRIRANSTQSKGIPRNGRPSLPLKPSAHV